MTIQRAYTTCRHGQLHYRHAGRAVDGPLPPLVLLHQNPSSSLEYEPLIAAMAVDRRVIALDTPGYGMSDPPPGPPGMAGYAAAFSDALDALGIADPIDLYGYHTGTLLAIELALLRPDLVGRLALTGIPMYPAEVRAAKLCDAQNPPLIDDAGTAILDHLARLWTYVVTNRAPGVALERAAQAFADKAKALDRSGWAYLGVWSYDYGRLAKVSQPVLLLQPHEDLREPSLAAADLLRDVTIRELPELDRDIFELAPERIADELRTYFR